MRFSRGKRVAVYCGGGERGMNITSDKCRSCLLWCVVFGGDFACLVVCSAPFDICIASYFRRYANGLFWLFGGSLAKTVEIYLRKSCITYIKYKRRKQLTTSQKAVKKYMNKTYKTCEVLLSIQDHATLIQFALEHNIGMSGLLYRAIIQYMENKYGVKLTGTATMRNE